MAQTESTAEHNSKLQTAKYKKNTKQLFCGRCIQQENKLTVIMSSNQLAGLYVD